MTTYSAPTGSEVGHKKPLTVSLVNKLLLNPIAMFEGASGAPRLHGNAVARPGAGLPVLSVSAADDYDIATDCGLRITTGTTVTSATGDVLAIAYEIDSYSGVMRFRVTHSGGGAISVLSMYKNGALVTFFNATSATARLVDVSIAPGDVIEWRHKVSGTGSSSVTFPAARASNTYTFVTPLRSVL